MFLTYLLNIFLTALLLFTKSNQEEIILKAELANSEVYKKEDLLTTLKLTNLTNKRLFILKYSSFNYESNCLDQYPCLADYYFIVQKKEEANYVDLEKIADIDEIPGFDSLGNPHSMLFDTLQSGQIKIEQFNILGYYRLQKGEYRVRFSYRIPGRNRQLPKIIYSAWIPFEVKSERVEYIY